MDVLLAQLVNSLEGKAILGISVLAVLDFATGSLRAIQAGQFALDSFATWVRTSLIHVVIITLVVVFGTVLGTIQIGDIQFNVLSTTGLVAAASYAATTVKSILDNLNPRVADAVPPPAT